VRQSENLIAAKARDMLAHYVTTVMPDGYKAQVVAGSRRGAVRYQQALQAAQQDLIAELDRLAKAPRNVQQASPYAKALPYRERIRGLKFAAVFSGDTNDPRSWRQWTREGRQKTYVQDFNKPFNSEDGSGHTAMLVVVSMLLTGFDAPLEQAMYIDRQMQGYELLQAIARVNRTYSSEDVTKDHGLVVDYYGLAQELHEAIEIYTRHQIKGVLLEFDQAEIPKLRDRYHRVVSIFIDRGFTLDDTDGCVNLLREAKLRAQFQGYLRQFLQTLNTVLPRPEALPYVEDARKLGLIRTMASKRYRDQHLEIAGAEAKVRQLIDTHILAQGVNPKIPPLDILDAEFEDHVQEIRSRRAQAAEMEFAIRHHIREHYQEDPVYFQKLSEQLESILQTFEENWEGQLEAFRDLIERHQETQENVSKEEKKHQPFLRLLMEAQAEEQSNDEQRERLSHHTFEMVEIIQDEIRQVDFWHSSKAVAQEKLRADLLQFLDNHDIVPFEKQEALVDNLMSTAKANHTSLTGEAL
jgi:type I restriction enzyme R subunit